MLICIPYILLAAQISSCLVFYCVCTCECVQELDAKERAQKQTVANQSAIEVRLNRALEEVEKNRTALQRARAESKVCVCGCG